MTSGAEDGSSGRRVDLEALTGTTRVLTAVLASSLANLAQTVTLPQWRVLVMISTRGALNLSAVAEGLGVNASNASRTCDRLVATGMLARDEDPRDRRHVVLSLTTEGRQVLDRVSRRRGRVLEQIVDRMDPSDQGTLATSLNAFLDAAAKASSEGELSDGEGHMLRWLV
ncbi:MAG TPA: MarR family transcriptional regulator [Nocardioidaceae bacterium]